MRSFQCLSGLAAALAAANPAAAQTVLDRVDPTRIEERKDDEVPAIPDDLEAVLVEPTNASASGPGVVVGAIDLVGLREMPRSAFAHIIERYVGRTLSGAELAELADLLASKARETYPLASATIERQTLRGGVLRVRIDEGRVDEIVLDGPANRAVLAAVQPLATGEPVTRADLERRLLLAGDVDGVSLGKARIERRDDRNVLVIPLAYSRFAAQITLDNDSTRPLGPLEVIASGRANGLLDHDDSLQALLLNSVPSLSELNFVRLRYANRIDASGTRVILTASHSDTNPGSYLSALEIDGHSWLAAAGLEFPILRSRRTSLWIDAALDYRELTQFRAGSLARGDHLTTARLSLSGATSLAGGNLRANAALSQGLDALNATRSGDPLSSRQDADGTFTKIVLSAQWSGKLVGALGLRAAVRTQLASQPLLVAEEVGIGGAQFGRGYDYSERTGDEGTMGYVELNLARKRKLGPVNGFDFYAFADGAEVKNLAGGFGGGTLFSSGGGMRIDVDRRTDAGFEVAVPLSGDRYDTDSTAPRIRFSVTRYF